MKYLVVYSGMNGEEKALCLDDQEATDLVESKLREGCLDSDIKIYAVEPVGFQVERIPVVKLTEGASSDSEAQASVEEPLSDRLGSDPLSDYTSDNKSEDINPFASEQVFSLDT